MAAAGGWRKLAGLGSVICHFLQLLHESASSTDRLW